MRGYHHNAYALRAQDIAEMDAEADYRQWARAADRQLARDRAERAEQVAWRALMIECASRACAD